MGLLVDGKWQNTWYDTKANKGRFERSRSQFRHWVTETGEAGPSGDSGFKAESGRYHLYVSLACPWANRTLIFLKLKGLEEHISVSVVHWLMQDDGWTFADDDGVIGDPIHHAKYYHEIYTAADSHYTGRVTVPVLWDKQKNTIVSNESSEIIRMFNTAFNDLISDPKLARADYYPEALQKEIDAVNERVYHSVNNGVYKAGFATTQAAYEEAIGPLFECLDWLEQRLASQRYIAGNQITEADWRLFTTLIRFDAVYVGHFKCNIRRIADYPNLSAYTRELFQVPGVAQTINMAHIKKHYYMSHTTINPTQVVPHGPQLDFTSAHGR